MLLKEIPITQLLPGMQVIKTDVGWDKVRYWQGPFTIQTAEDIVRLFESCKTVFIETQAAPSIEKEPSADRQPSVKTPQPEAKEPAQAQPKSVSAVKPTAKPKVAAKASSATKTLASQQTSPAKPTLVKTDSAEQALKRKISVQFAIESYHNTLTVLSDCFSKIKAGHSMNDTALQNSVKNLMLSSMAHPETLSMICNLKEDSQSLEQKSLDVAVLSLMFGQAIGMKGKSLHRLAMAALLHDIGMLRIPAEILNQKQMLSVGQRQLIQKHVELGCTLLKQYDSLKPLCSIIAFHHERHDGNGYPMRISGRKIPLESRILSIITTYEALTRNRHFSEQHSTTHALSKLYSLRNKAFDSSLVEKFIKAVGVYPVGSLIKLNNGYTGMVTEINQNHRSRPVVQLLYKPDGRALNNGSTLDLKNARYGKLQIAKTLQPESLTANTLSKLRQNLGFSRKEAA